MNIVQKLRISGSISFDTPIVNIFDNVSRPIFYDDVHVVDKGNEIIAKEIFSLINPLIE